MTLLVIAILLRVLRLDLARELGADCRTIRLRTDFERDILRLQAQEHDEAKEARPSYLTRVKTFAGTAVLILVHG